MLHHKASKFLIIHQFQFIEANMNSRTRIKATLVAIVIVGGAIFSFMPMSSVSAAASEQTPAMTDLLDYLKSHNTTGFLVIQDGKVLVEKNWPVAESNKQFKLFLYGQSKQGALFEDVASQQKSFIAVLVAIASDRGLIDVEKPVSAYVGASWSKATPEQEAKIRFIDLLTMSSGLDDKFGYKAPAGTVFYYNTPVYAVTQRVLAAVANQSLEMITRDWLTVPAGMDETDWRKRPKELAAIGNPYALVSTPRDVAKLGLLVLHGGISENGKRVVSEANLKAMFTRSANNPAYGRLWWLNGSTYTLLWMDRRVDGPLISAAPADLVGAYGAFERRLYVVPSRKLVVVRMGWVAGETPFFDEQLWIRLMKVID
jgi:CubicO group peptidase (beta-lactamase class C family)